MIENTTQSFEVIAKFLNFAMLGAAWVMWVMIGLAFILAVLSPSFGVKGEF